jgi:plasmid stabilization system protein ParE
MVKKIQEYTINWTPKALDTFEAITLQLIERWNIETAISFDQKTEMAINQLKNNPKIYQVSKKSKLRKCVIHKNVSLIYRINKNSVELVVFIDNRDEHSF